MKNSLESKHIGNATSKLICHTPEIITMKFYIILSFSLLVFRFSQLSPASDTES
jgi:hypothetical protein